MPKLTFELNAKFQELDDAFTSLDQESWARHDISLEDSSSTFFTARINSFKITEFNKKNQFKNEKYSSLETKKLTFNNTVENVQINSSARRA